MYTRLKILDWSSIDQYVSTLCICKNVRTSNYFRGHNILKDGVFVTQMSSNAGISVWWIVWVKTNCCFMRNKHYIFLHWVLSERINEEHNFTRKFIYHVLQHKPSWNKIYFLWCSLPITVLIGNWLCLSLLTEMISKLKYQRFWAKFTPACFSPAYIPWLTALFLLFYCFKNLQHNYTLHLQRSCYTWIQRFVLLQYF